MGARSFVRPNREHGEPPTRSAPPSLAFRGHTGWRGTHGLCSRLGEADQPSEARPASWARTRIRLGLKLLISPLFGEVTSGKSVRLYLFSLTIN